MLQPQEWSAASTYNDGMVHFIANALSTALMLHASLCVDAKPTEHFSSSPHSLSVDVQSLIPVAIKANRVSVTK